MSDTLVAIGLISTNRCYASGQTVAVQHAYFPFQNEQGARNIGIGVHNADVVASRLIAPDDEMQYAKILSLELLDIGCGDLNFRLKASA